MDAEPVLRLVARALAARKLEAVLIGNAAAALQGSPVTTVDLDFMFARHRRTSESSNASRTTSARESERIQLEQIRKLLALPPSKRTHFLRTRVPFRGSVI